MKKLIIILLLALIGLSSLEADAQVVKPKATIAGTNTTTLVKKHHKRHHWHRWWRHHRWHRRHHRKHHKTLS